MNSVQLDQMDNHYLMDHMKELLSPPLPTPVEQEHPELAEHLRLIANDQHPVVKTLVTAGNARMYLLRDGRRVIRNSQPIKQGRNESCACGSGKKHKWCCMSTSPA